MYMANLYLVVVFLFFYFFYFLFFNPAADSAERGKERVVLGHVHADRRLRPAHVTNLPCTYTHLS